MNILETLKMPFLSGLGNRQQGILRNKILLGLLAWISEYHEVQRFTGKHNVEEIFYDGEFIFFQNIQI
jgi:hypothetical protein